MKHKPKRPQPRGNQPHPAPAARPNARPAAKESTRDTSGSYWLYGWHAVEAALANEDRPVRRILASEQAAPRIKLPRKLPDVQVMPAREMDHVLGRDAVHQGIAALVAPLPGYVLEDVLHIANPTGPIVILDQVSDPHNVGAIMRSAAAFGAVAVVAPKDHSAPESAVMAKAACGACDMVPRITVTNLASAMRDLQAEGWWIVGLDGDAKNNLSQLKPSKKMVLVLGAEGKGMRRLTAELCDEVAKLPMDPRMESLNVSNASAIALYHLYASNHG